MEGRSKGRKYKRRKELEWRAHQKSGKSNPELQIRFLPISPARVFSGLNLPPPQACDNFSILIT